MATRSDLAATRERLTRQLKKKLPGSRGAKQIKKAIAEVDAQIAKPEVQGTPLTRRAGFREEFPLDPTGGAVSRGLETLGKVTAPFFRPPSDEVQGPPEAPITPLTGGPPTPAVEPAAPPRGAAPAAAGAPQQAAAEAAPEEDPDAALTPFLAQAEQSPELAAFKALLEAPAPVFEKAGFSTMERAMLGMLAGLRGTKTTLPIIEMRRQDARAVFNSAREVRAERLSGLFQAASLAEQQKSQRFQQNIATKRLAQGERQVQVAEGGLALRERAGQPQLRLLDASVVGDFAAAIDATALVRDFRQKFIREGMPGGVFAGFLPSFLRTKLQKETAADLQAMQQPTLAKFLGAVRSIPELEGIEAFISPFGSPDDSVLVSITAMERSGISAIRTEIRARKLAGFDTSGIEQLLFEKGFSGVEVQPSLIPTLPPHLGLDRGEVLVDEGAP